MPKFAHKINTACTAVDAPYETKNSRQDINATIMKPINALFNDTLTITRPTAREANSSANPDAAAITYILPLREVKYCGMTKKAKDPKE